MAMAAEQVAAGSAAEAPVVSKTTSRQATSIATKQAHAGISTSAHKARSQQSVKAHGQKQRQRVRAAKEITEHRERVRSDSRREQSAEKEVRRQQRELARQSEQARRAIGVKKDRRNQRLVSAATTPFQPTSTININRSNPVINPIMLILFTWAGIVLLYVLVSSPNATSGFLNSMREWIGLLYQTKPMFTTAELVK